MNLEHILDTQKNINNNLRKLLEENTQTVNFIVGSHPIPESKGQEQPEPNGILERIQAEQTLTAVLLEDLYQNSVKLYKATFVTEGIPVPQEYK